jgi:predicted RNase H-like HicB family nuclease
MRNKFTTIIERDGEWYIANRPEIPEAEGQGCRLEECRENPAEAITLTLDERGHPPRKLQQARNSPSFLPCL